MLNQSTIKGTSTLLFYPFEYETISQIGTCSFFSILDTFVLLVPTNTIYYWPSLNNVLCRHSHSMSFISLKVEVVNSYVNSGGYI